MVNFLAIADVNIMPFRVTVDDALSCCASKRFATQLADCGPHASVDELIAAAEKLWWYHVGVLDWLEAFAAHPKIGDKHAAGASPAQFKTFSLSEQQAAAQTTTEDVEVELRHLNQRYLDKFGFIFIICAKGRPALEILQALTDRLGRTPDAELHTAATEQMKITAMRLRTLLQQQQQSAAAVTAAGAAPPAAAQVLSSGTSGRATAQHRARQVMSQLVPSAAASASPPAPLRSPITTHVLDTATGMPAEGLPLQLLKQDVASEEWHKLSAGTTNHDGRVGSLLPPSDYLEPGRYRMVFHTGAYLVKLRQQHPALVGAEPFYPEVVVDFVITADKARDHYHIPLLLSPFGYSTYKGS